MLPNYLSLPLSFLSHSSFSPPLLPHPHLLLNSDRLGQRRMYVHMYVYAYACVSHLHCHQFINRGFLLGSTACSRSLTCSHTSLSVLRALLLLSLPAVPTSSQTLASDASFSVTVFSELHLTDSQNPRGETLSQYPLQSHFKACNIYDQTLYHPSYIHTHVEPTS